MQSLSTDLLNFFFDGFAEFPIGGGALKKSADQGFQVKRRSAHEQGPFALLLDFRDFGVSIVEELRNAVVLVWIQDVDQVVGDLNAGLRVWFRGSDVHTTVDRHGIDGDDFSAWRMVGQPLCQFEGNLCFS